MGCETLLTELNEAYAEKEELATPLKQKKVSRGRQTVEKIRSEEVRIANFER